MMYANICSLLLNASKIRWNNERIEGLYMWSIYPHIDGYICDEENALKLELGNPGDWYMGALCIILSTLVHVWKFL